VILPVAVPAASSAGAMNADSVAMRYCLPSGGTPTIHGQTSRDECFWAALTIVIFM
jgi:hypothetical protein